MLAARIVVVLALFALLRVEAAGAESPGPPIVTARAAQADAPATLRIAQIAVVGAARYTAADVIKLSGLATGQTVTPADLASANQKMVGTGLFKALRYRYDTTGDQVTVTFTIEEAAWGVPVIFDNFVWFSDREIVEAVARDVPTFDGTAPSEAGAENFIASALTRVLAMRAIQGQVEYTARADLRTGSQQYVFRVRDASTSLKTCALQFDGASAAMQSVLTAAAKDVVGTEYSRSYVTELSQYTLRDVYRDRGYWRASFAPPTATLAAGAPCNGIVLTLRVSEGPSYTWDRAEWTGNSVMATKDLDALLPLKPGQVASYRQIEAGLRAISDVYRTRGYLGQTAALEPRLDDASKRAVMTFAIREGAQFHMGTVTFAGMSERESSDLARQWQLKPGDVFDASYISRFMADRIRPRFGGRVTSDARANTATLTVNVTFTLDTGR